MPGLNGTGPMGEGPATGGGFGPCDGRTKAANINRPGMGRGAGRRGRARGLPPGFRGGADVGGRGRGRGFFGRRRFGAFADPAAAGRSPESESAALNDRLEMLERRIADLEAPESEPRGG
jgi:hypothetical protein